MEWVIDQAPDLIRGPGIIEHAALAINTTEHIPGWVVVLRVAKEFEQGQAVMRQHPQSLTNQAKGMFPAEVLNNKARINDIEGPGREW